MATFPTAEELQRPIPRIDGSVPTYQPAMTGEAGPRATYQAGQVIQSLGQDVGDFAQRLDAADAQDALNKFRQKRQELTYDPEKGFLRLKGRAALGKGPDGKSIMDTTSSALDTESEALSKNLSPRAAALFRARAINEAQSFKMDLVKHQMHESEKYEAAVYTDAQAGNLNRAALSAQDDRAIGIIAGQAGKLARQRAESLGMPGDAAAAGAQSDVLKAAVMMRIAKSDPSAIGFFEAHKDKFDVKDRLGLEQSIRTMRDGVEAKSWYATNNVPTSETAKAGIKTSMQHWTADGYSAPVAAGITAGFLRESQFNGGAVNPKDGRDGSDSISIGQWNGARGVAYKAFAASNGLDPRDPKTGLAYAKAEIDGVVPYSVSGLSPDFKARLHAAKSEREAADIMTRGYFRPLHTEGESAIRQGSASVILAEHTPAEPAQGDATPPRPPASSDGIVNARQMLIEIEQRKVDLTRKAQAELSGPVLQKALHEIEAGFTQQKAAIQLYKDKLYDAVQQHMNTGGPNGGPATSVPPANIFSQLTWEQQQSIERQVERNIAGKKTVTRQDVWYGIHQGLTSDNANVRDVWASSPLLQYKEFLSDQDFQELAKLQASVRKGEGKELTQAQTIGGEINSTLLTMNIDPTPKPGSTDAEKAATFHRAYQQELTTFEMAKGKKADAEDRQRIRDGLVKKVATEGWLWNGSQPVAFLTAKDVPATDRLQIISEIRRQGGVPTEERILQVYRHSLVNQPTQTEIPHPLEPPMLGLPGGTGSRAAPTAPSRPAQAPPRVIDNPTQDESRSVRDRYQDAMSLPSRDLATMAVSALRRTLGLE